MKKLLFIGVLLCCTAMLFSQEIARWSGFRKGVASFTFDDNAPVHFEDVAPLFDSYGYKATFYLVVNWNPQWSGFQEIADNGHEIGSHSLTHPNNMSGQEASSKEAIESHITNHKCLTVGYPNCNVPGESEVLKNYIAGRVCDTDLDGDKIPDIMGKNGPTNWTRIPAIITGSAGKVVFAADFISQFQRAISSEGWVVFMSHGIQGVGMEKNGNATYSPTRLDAISDALQWANQNDKEIWIAPLCNAAMYCKEYKSTDFSKKTSDASSVTYKLTHSIADEVCDYDYPLSLRVPKPEGWESVVVKQEENQLESTIKGDYIYFDAIPNNGDIVVANALANGFGDLNSRPLRRFKIVEDGMIYIFKNGRKFNVLGVEVK